MAFFSFLKIIKYQQVHSMGLELFLYSTIKDKPILLEIYNKSLIQWVKKIIILLPFGTSLFFLMFHRIKMGYYFFYKYNY